MVGIGIAYVSLKLINNLKQKAMTIIKYFRPDLFSSNGNERAHHEHESLNDLFFGPAFGNKFPRSLMANAYENDSAFRIEMTVPGVRKSNIRISVEKDVLSVRIDQQEETEGRITLKEYDFTTGQRSFGLPESVNAEKISSKLENGILTLDLPKKESAIPKGPTHIQIH